MRRRYQVLFQTYLGFISVFLLYVGVYAMRQHDRWAMGDWVTNYAGGFVRRGLIGHVALFLSHLPPHISLYSWVFLLQVICYATMFGTLLYLIRTLAWTYWMVVLLYSPATLLFPVLDPTSAFRKEVLFLAFLSTVVVVLRLSLMSDLWLAVFLAVGMVLLVLSHEGMLFYYPYVVGAILLFLRDLRRTVLVAGPGAAAGISAFVAASTHSGTFAVASSICASLGETALSAEPCSGAIVYMTRSPDIARHDVLTAISYWHLSLVMPFLMIMALTPVILGLRTLWQDTTVRYDWWVLVCCICASWLATTGLFLYGFDWNRWIYVHVFSTLILMLLIEHRRQQGATAAQRAVFTNLNGYNYTAILAAVLMTCTWQLSFYHHFPLPGDTLAVYMRDRLHHHPLHKALDWSPITQR